VSECPNESEYLYYDMEHPSAVLHDWAARTIYAQLVVPEPGELALSLTALGLMGFMAAVAAAPESSCASANPPSRRVFHFRTSLATGHNFPGAGLSEGNGSFPSPRRSKGLNFWTALHPRLKWQVLRR
jgi:hypothetical protein